MRIKKKYLIIPSFLILFIYIFLSIFSSISTFRVSSESSNLDPSYLDLEYEDIDIVSGESIISSWWIPNNKDKTILILHGLRSQKDDEYILNFIREFHNLGYSIIAIDFRNHGDSSKGNFTFGVDEINDVYNTIEFYNSYKNIEEIGIWGFSYGATTANLAAINNELKNNNSARIVGVFSDSPYFSLTDLISSQISRRTPLNEFMSDLLKPGILLFTNIFYNFDFNSVENTYIEGSKVSIPTKIIGCTGDQTVPIDQSINASNTLGQLSSFVEFSNCLEHGDAFISDPEKYLSEFKTHFDKAFQSEAFNKNNENIISDFNNYPQIDNSNYILDKIDIDRKFDNPWAIEILNTTQAIISEKKGELTLVNFEEKTARNIDHNIPSVQVGQGGLLDIVIHEQFLYASFSKKNDKEEYTTAIGRGILSEDYSKISEFEIIFEALPYFKETVHFGSRLIIQDDYLYASIGERGKGVVAQELDSHAGSIIRINLDGTIPNNPFSDESNLDEIYMIGLRNPQGMAINENGDIYITNHGAKGGDFLGLIFSGGNYGWNKIGWGGKNYSGTNIGSGKSFLEDYNIPLISWVPSIAPSDLIFYKGEEFPNWNGKILVSSLKFKLIVSLEIKDNSISQKEIILKDKIGRIRDIEVNPKGEIFIITDEKNSYIWKLRSSK